jgi:ABC-type Fe3+-siderophore transport system permease subunit
MSDERQDEYRYKGSLGAGLVVTVALHMLQIPIAVILAVIQADFFLTPLMFIGLSQLVYIIPAIIRYRRKGESETVKGLIAGASVTFLLNAACTGMFLRSLQFG